MVTESPLEVPATTSLDSSEESVMGKLYLAAIGQVNADYYRPILERFESKGRIGPSWNLAASLCTFSWMVFRKMGWAALMYATALLVTVLLVLGLGRLLFHVSDTLEWCLLAALGTVAFLVPGVWGNALLHAHVRRSMESALTASPTVAQACVLLNRSASTRPRLITIALAHVVAVVAVVAIYATWPAVRHPPAGANQAFAPLPAASSGGATAAHASGPITAPPPLSSALGTATVASAPVAFTSAEKRFFVNVGLFADEGNAVRAHAKLTEAGLSALMQEMDMPKGKRTRVQVGPFDTPSQADAAAQRIRAMALDAVVTRQ